MGTEWVLRSSDRVTDRLSYQSFSSALNASQRDMNLYAAGNYMTDDSDTKSFLGRSLWSGGNAGKPKSKDT